MENQSSILNINQYLIEDTNSKTLNNDEINYLAHKVTEISKIRQFTLLILIIILSLSNLITCFLTYIMFRVNNGNEDILYLLIEALCLLVHINFKLVFLYLCLNNTKEYSNLINEFNNLNFSFFIGLTLFVLNNSFLSLGFFIFPFFILYYLFVSVITLFFILLNYKSIQQLNNFEIQGVNHLKAITSIVLNISIIASGMLLNILFSPSLESSYSFYFIYLTYILEAILAISLVFRFNDVVYGVSNIILQLPLFFYIDDDSYLAIILFSAMIILQLGVVLYLIITTKNKSTLSKKKLKANN